jgi:hypothetical protein
MLVDTFWKLKIRKGFADYSYDLQLFPLCLVVMWQGPCALAIASFPGAILLRWEVAMAALVAASLLGVFSRPQLPAEGGAASS